jgi:DNA repair protein RecO (recombination protein O)
MNIEEKGIIISVRKFQESSFIVKCLLEESGIISGLHKPRKSKFIQEPMTGSIAKILWNARLEEHLGFLNYENILNVASLISHDKILVLILNSLLNLVNILLVEKEPHNKLFYSLEKFLNNLASHEGLVKQALRDYIHFEIFELLGTSGFGLDLTQCIVTGEKENLIYISPKSAAAVSEDIGKPYHNKLFMLPAFLLDCPNMPKTHELQEAFRLSAYFIEKHLLKPFNKSLPVARILLHDYVMQLPEES